MVLDNNAISLLCKIKIIITHFVNTACLFDILTKVNEIEKGNNINWLTKY